MDFVTTHVVSAVGITLVHFLWQGTAIGLVTAAVLATCPRAMARTRYGIAGAGLAAMTMAPLVTLGLVWQTAPAMTATLPAFATEVHVQTGDGRFAGLPVSLSHWLPVAVAVWAFGVATLTARLLVAWFRTERVRRRDVHPVSDGLTAAVRRLARNIGIHRPIAIFESRWVDVPTVIGWMRPTILLPIGALTGLSVQQIEAVLSHELAHIKRHDYLVNVLQNFAETVFFYHPAVWWLSKQIRVEREHCCDDVAVEACGNPLLYARALAALEESRQRSATFALAATDGSLVQRVRRLVGRVHDDRREPSLPIAACVAVILAVVAFGAAQAQGSITTGAAADDRELYEQMQQTSASLRGARQGATVPSSSDTQEVTPESAVPYVRIDAGTIRMDGETYRRGSAEDLRRALASRAAAQRDATVTSSSDAQEVTPEAPRVIRVGGAIKEPRKIRHVSPAYPQAARDAGISGVVILEATIDTEGLPVGIKILRSIPDLDQAAINAVRQWRYEPTLLNGEPVSVMMTVTVNFTLQTAAQQQEALERRLVELTRLLEQDAASGTTEQLEARYRELQLERVRLLQQLEMTRAIAERRQQAAERSRQDAVATVNPTLATPRDPGAPLRIGGPVREPRKVHHVSPIYPKIAQASNVSGVVILDIIVSAGGDVTDVSIVRSIPMLDSAAIEAVRQWRYTPTLLNGVPTPVQMTVTVNFTLQ